MSHRFKMFSPPPLPPPPFWIEDNLAWHREIFLLYFPHKMQFHFFQNLGPYVKYCSTCMSNQGCMVIKEQGECSAKLLNTISYQSLGKLQLNFSSLWFVLMNREVVRRGTIIKSYEVAESIFYSRQWANKTIFNSVPKCSKSTSTVQILWVRN